MRRLKVVHVHKIAGISGSEKHLLQLLPSLDPDRFDPVMLMLVGQAGRDEEYAARLRAAGVRVERLPIRGHIDPLLLLRLAAWFRRERPDIVHTHLIHADAHAVPAARLAGVSIVISTKHNDDRFRRQRLMIVLERWLARGVDKTIAISDALRRFLIESAGQNASAIATVRYGYDPSLDGDSPTTAAVPLLSGPRIVLAVGRLVDQKGHDVLIRAFESVRACVPDARLVIVGAGERRVSLEALVAERGLGDCVSMPGHRPDARAFMREAAVFAHPSRWEGFGLVLLEAMAEGRPIVATRVSAIPEIVEHGVTGLLVPVDDDRALAAALVQMLQDRPLALRMGEAGRERLHREFSLARMARETEEIYREAAGAHPQCV